jgi:hypothetical protein
LHWIFSTPARIFRPVARNGYQVMLLNDIHGIVAKYKVTPTFAECALSVQLWYLFQSSIAWRLTQAQIRISTTLPARSSRSRVKHLGWSLILTFIRRFWYSSAAFSGSLTLNG